MVFWSYVDRAEKEKGEAMQSCALNMTYLYQQLIPKELSFAQIQKCCVSCSLDFLKS